MRRTLHPLMLACILTVAASGAVLSAEDVGESYVFTNIEIGPQPDPVTGEPLPGHARVFFDAQWAAERFPGKHQCVWRLYDAQDNPVGETERYLVVLEKETSRQIYTDLNVLGQPARAEIACNPTRLDDPETKVMFRNITVSPSAEPADRVDVSFEYGWTGTSPGAQMCIIRARGKSGQVTAERSTPFVPGDATGTWLESSTWLDADTHPRDLAGAEISCHPYEGL